MVKHLALTDGIANGTGIVTTTLTSFPGSLVPEQGGAAQLVTPDEFTLALHQDADAVTDFANGNPTVW